MGHRARAEAADAGKTPSPSSLGNALGRHGPFPFFPRRWRPRSSSVGGPSSIRMRQHLHHHRHHLH
jgi:hypothetical protein